VTTYLSQVQAGAVTSVIVVAVHMENLLALDGQETRQDTFCQSSAENDDLEDVVSPESSQYGLRN
jgi:hypothetical protein